MEATFFEAIGVELDEILKSTKELKQQARMTATWWDNVKERIRRSYIAVKRECEHKLRNSYRQRLRRLNEEWRAAMSATQQNDTRVYADEHLASSSRRSPREVRQSIAECKRSWAETKAQRLRRSHVYTPYRSSKDFFRRIATKFSDNTIYSLGTVGAGGRSSPRLLADAMAEGWKHVMQQDQLGVKEIQKYLEKVVPLVAIDGLDSLTSTITSEEIRAAIKRCKRGKAYGPDEICNDWYRDHHEQLTPILEKIMNLWYSTGIVPQSFKDANIHCLKKTKTASRPLDHRPIALLNTDYKVYTRIFATRLRPLLPHLVHTLQAGFVPGRSIHTPIDTFLAIRKVADRDPRLAKGIGLLLDFAKAYDSLNRAFLVCVLQLYNFPKIFVDMVAVLHEDTACRFLVNGFLSSKIQVSCGIRQGCPLAPLLFIIALDVLYRVVETMPDIGGIPLVCGSSTTIRISGYADDTALYLADADDIPKILEVIRDYGSVSGLQVNLKKSVGVMMSTRSHGVETNGYGIPILQHGDSTRYLGIQVGSFDTHDANWGGLCSSTEIASGSCFCKNALCHAAGRDCQGYCCPKSAVSSASFLAHGLGDGRAA
jgi:hypothetical protein